MRKVIIPLALVVLAGPAWARTLSPAEALDRALGDAATPARVNAMNGLAAKAVTPAFTLTDKTTGTPSLYVITPSDGKGFIVVSADDVATPLLGYTDNGTFDPENMPENLRWWLGQYDEAISAAINGGVESMAPNRAVAYRKAIAPMATTRWNQDAPYNNDCPMLQGQRTVTGCVATAVAQILKYHNWPETGTGIQSYSWSNGGTTLTYDFSKTTFKWDDMLDVYDSSATPAQNAAVAELMYACGVGVQMNYHYEASGAISTNVAPALRDFFNYDKGVQSLSRYNYSLAEWEDLVYDELANGPVYYSGSGTEGGHAFVCDGYADGYFHFNWGWGGMSDGYFLLNALDPASQGIGGYTTGFNQRQAIVAGIKKPVENSKLPAPNITLITPMTVYKQTAGLTITGPFYNYTPYDMKKTYFAVSIVNDETGETLTRRHKYPVNVIVSGWLANFQVNVSTLDPGTYTGTVGVIYDDVFYPVRPVVGDSGKIRIVKTENDYEATVIRNGELTFGPLTAASSFYQGKMFGLTAEYNYESETPLYTQLVPILTNSAGQTVSNGAPVDVDINPGKGTYTYTGSFLKDVNAGKYYIALYRSMGTNAGGTSSQYLPVTDPIAIEVKTLSWTRDPIVSCSEWEIKDADSLDPSTLTITASPQVTMGYYAGSVLACVFNQNETQLRPSNAIATFYSPTVFIDQGNKQAVTITGDFVAGETGKTYQVKLFTDNNTTMTQTPKTFTVGERTAITEIEADNAADGNAEYFNLQGVRVDNPIPGLYIRRQGGKTEKVYIR